MTFNKGNTSPKKKWYQIDGSDETKSHRESLSISSAGDGIGLYEYDIADLELAATQFETQSGSEVSSNHDDNQRIQSNERQKEQLKEQQSFHSKRRQNFQIKQKQKFVSQKELVRPMKINAIDSHVDALGRMTTPNSPFSPFSILLKPSGANEEDKEVSSNEGNANDTIYSKSFESTFEHEIVFESIDDDGERSPALNSSQDLIERLEKNYIWTKTETDVTSRPLSFRNFARKLTPLSFSTHSPATDEESTQIDDQVNEESKIYHDKESYEKEFHETETVVAKNTSKTEFHKKEFHELETVAGKNTLTTKENVQADQFLIVPVSRRKSAQTASERLPRVANRRRSEMKKSCKEKKKKSCFVGLSMGNILVALLIAVEIIVLSSIGTSYLGSMIAIQKYNFTEALNQASYQLLSAGNQGSLTNVTNTRTNPCNPQQALLTLKILFDSRPADFGIVVKESGDVDGSDIWNIKPASVFQSSTALSGRTNIFSICVQRIATYALEISDKNCDGLSSTTSGDAVFGKWEVEFDGIPIIQYNGNCTGRQNDEGEFGFSLINECGLYGSCSYTLSGSGIFGSCNTLNCPSNEVIYELRTNHTNK